MEKNPSTIRREELNEIFVQILTDNGVNSRNVYFQPPEGLKIQHPAIVYERADIVAEHADNSPYRLSRRYLVTVLDKDPDSAIVEAVANLPQCRFDRHFAANQLNHDVYSLTY